MTLKLNDCFGCPRHGRIGSYSASGSPKTYIYNIIDMWYWLSIMRLRAKGGGADSVGPLYERTLLDFNVVAIRLRHPDLSKAWANWELPHTSPRPASPTPRRRTLCVEYWNLA